MRPQPECPECEKLSRVSEESNKIGEFLDYFIGSKGIILAEWDGEDLVPMYQYHGEVGINRLLAEYFKIDLDKVERERRELLKWLQEIQA